MYSASRVSKQFFKTMKKLPIRLIKRPAAIDKAEKFFEKAQSRRRVGKFDHMTEELYYKAIKATSGKNPRYWEFYLKYLWDTKGVTHQLLKQYAHAIKIQKQPAPGLMARYTLILNEAGNTDLAFKYYKKAKNLKAKLFNEYLAINAMAAKTYENPGKDLVAKKWLLDELKKHESTFRKLVEKNKDSLCIVGNSASELNSGNGAKIDRHKLIIRFNNFNVEAPYDKDYGEKTNIWVRSAEGSPVQDRDTSAFDLVMISGGNFIHADRRWKMINEYIKNGAALSFFPNSSWYELVAKLEAPPSAGLLTLYSIYKLIGPIPRSSVFGFSFVDQLDAAHKAHYFDDAKPGNRHNWQKEREIFESLLEPGE